jgi:hypothetical protein
VENGQLRAAFDGTTRSRVKIFGNVDRTWYHLFDVEPHVPQSPLEAAMVTSDSQLGGGELSSRDSPQDAAATITLDGVDRPLTISFPASQLGAGGQLDVNLDGSQRGLAVTPSGFSWITSLDGKALTVRIGTYDGATVPDPTDATKSVVAFRTSGPSRPLSLDITTSGLTGTLTPSQVFTQAQLIHDQGIRYLWTWRSTDMLAELAARPCMQLVFENDDVAIFSVDGNCRG